MARPAAVALFTFAVLHLFALSSGASGANDNFANAQVIVGRDGMAGTLSDNSFGTGTEAGEPDFVSTYGESSTPVGRSVWYRWTAPTNGTAVFETLNSDYNTALSIYTGSSVNSLTLVAGNDDVNTGVGDFVHREGFTSFVEFFAVAGTTYQVRVASPSGGGGGVPGHIVLDWSLNGVQSTNLFSGQFRFATDFLGSYSPTLNRYTQRMFDGHVYPLAIFSENETVIPGGLPYARLAVTRVGGAHGRVYVDYEIVPLTYTNYFITNYFGTNYEVSDFFGYTNIYSTNYIVTNIYGNYTWYIPERRMYLTNIFAYNDTFRDENGNATFVTTNIFFPLPYKCTSVSFTTNIVDTNTPPNTTTINSNYFCVKIPTVTTNIPSFITNTSPADIRDVAFGFSDLTLPYTNHVLFDDYQMSADIAVQVLPGGGPAQYYLGGSAPPVNRVFQINLTAVHVDPQESSDILQPYVFYPGTIPALGSIHVNIMENDIAIWDGYPTNAVINMQRATYRTSEKNAYSSPPVLYAIRGGTNTQAVTVDYRINFRSPNHPFDRNIFPLQPGSEHTTYTPYTNSPYFGVHTNDFAGVTGTVAWGANDFGAKPLDVMMNGIPIVDDEYPEFNEDIWVELYNPLPAGNNGAIMGNLGEYFNVSSVANLTILFDDQPAGAVDRGHNPEGSVFPNVPFPGANQTVMALAVQPDSKTIIAGDFTSFNGNTRNRIARCLVNGHLDASFLAAPNSGANRFISTLALHTDGSIIAGGDFTSFNGFARNRIVHLDANGGVDQNFNPGLGANDTVWSVALQTDGKVIIGGDFTMVGGVARNHIARLNTDGTLDTSFDPGTGADGTVNAVAVQTDGKIIIGGEFATVAGASRSGVARFNSNGTLDTGYNPGAGANGPVFAVTLQPDGKALIGGAFTTMDLRNRNRLARLNTNGSLDTGFDPGVAADDAIYAITLQSDAKILIGGLFRYFNETRRVGIARLYDFGSVDTTFMDTALNQYAGLPNQYHNEMIEPRNFVFSIGVQPDGGVMIGGGFQRVGGGNSRTDVRIRKNIARLIGNSTPGPGNIELVQNQYSADENGGTTYVSLIRTNGDRGMVNARFLAAPTPPGPGASTLTNFTLFPNYNRPFWDRSWPGPSDASFGHMRSDANYDPNYDPLAAPGVGGSPSANVLVTILDNSSINGDRSADYFLYRPTGTEFTLLGGENIPFGTALMRRAAPMTILEDDVRPGTLGFSFASYAVNEGVVNAVITVTRTNGTVGPVTVSYQTVPRVAGFTNATGVVDYTPVSGTLTFLSGQDSKTFFVPIIDDSAVEFDEGIDLLLSNPTGGAALGLTNAVLTIIDNDFPAGRLNFSTAAFSTNENAGFARITVNRTGGGAGSLTVQCATGSGTALAGADYIGITNTLAWTNGDVAPKALIIPLLDDVLIESNETVNVRLFAATLNGSPTNTPLGSLTNAVLTIISDDALGAVRFSTTTYSINENGGAGYVTVVRTGGSSEAISVGFSATNGSAVAGYDFTATNGTLAFAPGEFSKTFTVPILDNDFPDGSRFISLLLSNASPANGLGIPQAALLNIIDNELVNEPPGSPDTGFSDQSGMNGAVHALALQPDGKIVAAGEFTMANGLLRNRIARLETDGALDTGFSTTEATAGANANVRALIRQTDGRLVIGGEFTTVNNINLNRIARLNFNGSVDTGFNPGAGTDNPVLAVAETFVGDARKLLLGGTFTVFDSIARNNIARLNDDGTLDVAFDPGLGVNGTVYAIAVQTDGRAVIGGDFTTVNGIGRNRIARLNADGSLDLSFDPGNGANDSVRAVAIQLDGRILIGGSFTNYDGTAINRLARLLPDGSLEGSGTFNLGEGANDTVNSITVQPDTRIVLGGQFTRCSGVTRNHITRLNNDGSVDPTINFGAGANNFVSATLVQPDSKIVLGGGFTDYDGVPSEYITRIYGGSVVGSGRFEYVSATFQASEAGTNAMVTVRRRGGTSSPVGQPNVTVDSVTSDGTAINGINYTGGTFTLSFPAGEVLKSFLIPVTDDLEINDDRTVNLSLGNITPPASASLGDQPTATLVILNDDSAITFESATYSRNENAIDGVATISIVRSGTTFGTASVDFQTTGGGTATAGADYTSVNTPVVFNPGETLKTVTVPITNDGSIEGDETVMLQLVNVTGALGLQPSQAVLTIVDNDFGPGQISFANVSYSVGENGTNAVISLVRANGQAGVVSVNFYTSDGTANAGLDYNASSGSVVFNDSETAKAILVPITDDSFVEGPETFSVTLSNATGGATIVGATNASVTIVDNDVGFTFAAPFYVVGEAGVSLTLTVLRINGSNGVATVNYGTTNGTASAGADYGTTSGSLTFANGETLKTFTVPIYEDTLVEGDEVFSVRLSNPTGALLVNSNVLVTILDNDTGLRFAQAAYSVNEGDGNVVLTVIRTNVNTGVVSVSYALNDETALAGDDYAPGGGVLTFNDGESMKTITVPILNDTLVEGNETFQVVLSNLTGGAQFNGPDAATVTITDNDAGIKFSSSTYSVTENGVQAVITVQRTSTTNTTVSVNYATSDGTAVNGSDYFTASGTLTFNSGQVSKTFNVPIIDDTLIEGDETVLLKLSNPTGQASLLNPNAATLTIGASDGSLILPAGSALTSESGPANGGIDPGETVTLLFALRNAAGENTTNLVATLLATNGVTSPSGPQNYGTLVSSGPSVSRSFTFTANGTNGGTVGATFLLDDNSTNNLGQVTFNYQLGSSTVTFSNPAAITINDRTGDAPAPATPYPSVINVAGLGGSVSKVTVALTNLAHTAPGDIDMLLVGPTGTSLLLMSDTGSGNLITNVTLTFDDAAASSLPFSSQIVSGAFKPTNYLLGDMFTNAPPAPWGTVLADFNGSNPNGAWSLYVVDDTSLDTGSVVRGWKLNLTTTGVIPAAADLSVTATATPDPVIVTSNVTYTIVVANHGPSTATGITLADTLPTGATLVSSNVSQGNISAIGGVVTWTIGTLAKDATATATLVARPTVVGTATNFCAAFAVETDPNTANNTATTTTTVNSVSADLLLAMFATPSPLTFGQDLTYTLLIANLGPATASGVTLTNTLPSGVSFVSASPAAYVVNGNTVAFTNLGSLGSGWGTNASITVHPNVGGTLTNTAFCASGVTDPLKGNNTVTVKTLVEGMAPELSIKISGGNLVLSWPASATGFVLERTTSLTPPAWTEVTVPAPVTVGDQKTVTLPLSSGSEYFRLRASP